MVVGRNNNNGVLTQENDKAFVGPRKCGRNNEGGVEKGFNVMSLFPKTNFFEINKILIFWGQRRCLILCFMKATRHSFRSREG